MSVSAAFAVFGTGFIPAIIAFIFLLTKDAFKRVLAKSLAALRFFTFGVQNIGHFLFGIIEQIHIKYSTDRLSLIFVYNKASVFIKVISQGTGAA